MNIILWLFSMVAQAAITNVRVEPAMAQLIIRYTAPDQNACSVQVWDMNLQADASGPKATVQIKSIEGNGAAVTVETILAHGFREGRTWRVHIEGTEVSGWDGPQTITVVDTHTFTFLNGTSGGPVTTGNVGQLAHDVNPDLFPGSDLDSRASSNNYGTNRVFVAGTRALGVPSGTDIAYSRALQSSARHKFRITCGADTFEDYATTGNIPLGYLSIDYPKPAYPGGPIAPTFDKSARWDKSDGIYLDRATDPVTGVMYTVMYPPELIVDTAYALSTSNTPTPTGTNWSNPGNVRTQDASSATYSAATKDILCVKPYLVVGVNGATKSQWYTQNTTLENLVVTMRASGAANPVAQGDRDLEIAINNNGDCVTPATEWQTISPPGTGSLTDISFPSGTPKGAFAEWHSATQRRLNHMDVVTKRGYLNTSGTTLTWQLDGNYGQQTGPGISLFDPAWVAGTKIRVGADSTVCSAGTEYTIASVVDNRTITINEDAGTQSNRWWCVSQFALLIRKKSTSTDTVSLDYVTFSMRETRIPNEHDSGSAKIFSEKPKADADGNLGYVGYTQGAGGTTYQIHWVGRDNGESRWQFGHLVNLPAGTGFSGGNCNAIENTFSTSAPDTMFCLMNKTGGGQSVVGYKFWNDGPNAWKGTTPSSTPPAACSTTVPASPNPCLEPRNLTGSYNLLDLIQDRNPAFDPAKFTGCGARGIQTHYMYLTCQRSVQDTVAWWVMYDLDKPIGSYDEMDQSTNPVVGAVPTWDVGFRGMAVYHTGFVLPSNANSVNSHFTVFDPKFGRKNSATNYDGAGPWRMAISGSTAINNTTDVFQCPPNRWNHINCSTIVVTSHPFDPDPGPGETGAAGEYANAEVGNGGILWKCDPGASAYTHETITESVANSGCQSYANFEWVRIIGISGTAPTISLTVARGLNSGGMKSHAAGYSLFQWPLTDYNNQAVDVNMVWDFVACPTGGSLDCMNYAGGSTSHGSLSQYGAVGYSTGTGLAQVAWVDPSISSYQGAPQVNLNLSLQVWPAFAGKYTWRFMGPTQRYNANNHVDFLEARKPAYQWFVDSRPDLYGTIGSEYHWQFLKVGGTAYIYQYHSQLQGDTRIPVIKHLEFLVQSNGKTLVDVSGPSSTLNDTIGDYYKKCIAWKADECRTGSKFGDIFLNLPSATLGSFTKYSCGGVGLKDTDICATPLDPMSGPNVQFWYGSGPNMGQGRHIRKLGWGAHASLRNSGQVPKVYPNGEWLGPLWVNFLNEHRSGAGLMMKLPPLPHEDGIDRTTFVPIPITSNSVPAGTAFAQVEYGYAFYGTPSQLYCTERRESCLATGSGLLKNAAIRNPWTTSNQDGSWQYTSTTMTSGSPYTLTFASPHKFSSDVRVRATTGTTSALYYRTWPINITSPTAVELVGSVAGDIGSTGTVTSLVEKLEAPFAFSGESFSVAGATNAPPIEITTTTRHTFQTGSNVCVSGVGGNSAANGCWAITATGPSSFTLTGSTGNGSYTSGGTISPGGVACASGCTVVVAGKPAQVMHYRLRYLDSTGGVLATGKTETVRVP